MSFGLRSGVFFRILGNQGVFLDLPADRYFCLPPEANASFVRMVRGKDLSGDDFERLDHFVGTGLLHALKGNEPPPPETAALTPTLELLASAGVVSPWSISRAVSRQIAVANRAKRCSFEELLREYERRKTALTNPCEDIQTTRQIVSAFWHADGILPSKGKCVRRSLAMGHELLHRGIAANVVVGVTWPLKAHCWVQKGDFVLSDALDVIRPFMPILVL